MNLSDTFKYVQDYMENHSTPEDEVLFQLRRFTYLKAIHPRMLSGPVQGKFLELISRLKQPDRILEIGTYTGYSAICLARGLKPKGMMISIDINDELQEKAKRFFIKAGISEKINCINGNAIDIIPQIKEEFDLVFIDGEKEQYSEYYNLCIPKLKSGGILLADNVLWDGKVLDPKLNTDTATKAIIEFNHMVQEDDRVENVLLPLRDGISIIWKK